MRYFLLVVAVLAAAASAAAPLADLSVPPGIKPVVIPPITDDSMWVKVDSVSIGAPSGFWRGLCLDPNGVDVWTTFGDGVATVRKINRLTGGLTTSFSSGASGPYDIVRFGDSLCIAYYSSSRLGIYDTLGNFGRFITTPANLRGLDWDGTNFWVSVTSTYRLYRISRAGVVFDTLTPTVNPSWMGVISLDRTFANRIWVCNGTAATNNIHYSSFDTVAGTWTILATFSHEGVGLGYPGGLGFEGPVAGGSYQWVLGRSSSWLWRVKVHDPIDMHDVGVSHIVAPAGAVDSGAVVTPACSVYNFGTYTESFTTRVRVGALDTVASISGLAPGTRGYVEFAPWTAPGRGTYAVSCSTELAGDAIPANNRLVDSVTVRVLDVAAVAVVDPLGTFGAGSAPTPAGLWRNRGTVAASFEAWMLVDNPLGARAYAQKVDVADLPPGNDAALGSFPPCTLATIGRWAVRCSTGYAGDMVPANDVALDSFTVDGPDLGVVRINYPTGNVRERSLVHPGVKVRNFGPYDAVCGVRVRILDNAGSPLYDTTETGIWLTSGDSASFSFAKSWLATPRGDYSVKAWTVCDVDPNPANDTASAAFVVGTGSGSNWTEVAQVPLTPSGKAVKDGGWLAWDALAQGYYTAKAYKTSDFYRYDPLTDAWTDLAPWPLGVENKGPYKGAVAVSDGNGTVYATKGNNTTGFWKYSAADSTWSQLADVPLGLSNKKVKGGTDLAYVQDDTTGWVYLLKGYKTEFYRYNTVTSQWQTLADAPAGVKAKYDKGSWLVADAAGRKLYAHKAKYMELYAYDMDSLSWGPLQPGMPLVNNQTGKSKKAKDGSDAVLIDGVVYALKGGNTIDFYALDLATMTWAERETIPSVGTTGKKKRVKGGGSMATDGVAVTALKGNKTLEVWRYVPVGAESPKPKPQSPRAGVQGDRRLQIGDCRLQIVQNPSRGKATVRWSGIGAGRPTVLAVYDAVGRLVLTRSLEHSTAGALSLPVLSPGVYLLRVSGGLTATRKLVIE